MIKLNFVNSLKEIFLIVENKSGEYFLLYSVNNSCKYEFGDFDIIVMKSFVNSFVGFDVVKN